jgi:hypothetical protein
VREAAGVGPRRVKRQVVGQVPDGELGHADRVDARDKEADTGIIGKFLQRPQKGFERANGQLVTSKALGRVLVAQRVHRRPVVLVHQHQQLTANTRKTKKETWKRRVDDLSEEA